MKKIIAILVIILVIVGGGAWYLLKDDFAGGNTNNNEGLITFIDRNVPAEHEARLMSQITRMKNDIGDRVGEKASLDDIERWIGMGNLYYVLGYLKDAREATETALRVAPANYIAQANLGDILNEMGDKNGALQSYQKTLEIAQFSPYYVKYVDFLKAEFPERKDEYEKALIETFNKLGRQPEFLSRLAAFYMEEGRYEEAITHYEALVPLVPEDTQTIKDLFKARELFGKQKEDAKNAEAAGEIQ